MRVGSTAFGSGTKCSTAVGPVRLGRGYALRAILGFN